MSISELVGGLFPTALVTLLLATLFEKVWGDRLSVVLTANGLSALICVLLGTGGYGTVNKGISYLIPQAVVLALTVFRWRGRQKAALGLRRVG